MAMDNLERGSELKLLQARGQVEAMLRDPIAVLSSHFLTAHGRHSSGFAPPAPKARAYCFAEHAGPVVMLRAWPSNWLARLEVREHAAGARKARPG